MSNDPSTKGNCLDLSTAGQIIQMLIPGGPHAIDSSLKDVGLVTSDQREFFRQHVLELVLKSGCHIEIADIPNGEGTKLRDIRDALSDLSS